MIEVENLTQVFGDKAAVDDLTFTVGSGTVTGLLGPNGAGKSTTMRMIVGLDRPARGSARVNGEDFRPAEHTRRARDPRNYADLGPFSVTTAVEMGGIEPPSIAG
ncbi:hypothetical protein ASF40_07730 [Microbacterium sp. Leaf288]|nr:hypothetical protein ASF40_07730 [Microbacterium sp. Leaf288]